MRLLPNLLSGFLEDEKVQTVYAQFKAISHGIF
ncbi:MAG: hypothetical protein ACI9FN_003987, partial [Saprospiraceae bacterium]